MTIVKENLQALRTYIASLDEATVMLDQVKCGACFCLIGHAATMPHFNEQGLAFDMDAMLTLDGEGINYDDVALTMPFGDLVSANASLFAPFGEGPENDAQLTGLAGRREPFEKHSLTEGLIAGKRVSHKELAIARLDYAISLET